MKRDIKNVIQTFLARNEQMQLQPEQKRSAESCFSCTTGGTDCCSLNCSVYLLHYMQKTQSRRIFFLLKIKLRVLHKLDLPCCTLSPSTFQADLGMQGSSCVHFLPGHLRQMSLQRAHNQQDCPPQPLLSACVLQEWCKSSLSRDLLAFCVIQVISASFPILLTAKPFHIFSIHTTLSCYPHFRHPES